MRHALRVSHGRVRCCALRRGDDVRLPHVEPITGTGQDDTGQLWVEVGLTHILLASMNEEQLWGHYLALLPLPCTQSRLGLIICLQAHVPQSDSTISTGGYEAVLVLGVPLQSVQGATVPREGGDGRFAAAEYGAE